MSFCSGFTDTGYMLAYSTWTTLFISIFLLFPLDFHLKPKSLSVSLLLLRVSRAKEHFPNPTQPQVPGGTPEALWDRKPFSSRIKELEDSFVYYCVGNVLKNGLLDLFQGLHTTTSKSK